MDADGSGVIDYTEFLAATLDRLMGSPWVASVINHGWLENPRTELGFEFYSWEVQLDMGDFQKK